MNIDNFSYETLDEDKRIKILNNTRKRLLWITPGILESEAEAFSNLIVQIGRKNIKLVLNKDFYNLKYSYKYFKGIQKANDLNLDVLIARGIGLGIIFSDDYAYIFNPNLIYIPSVNSCYINCVKFKLQEQNADIIWNYFSNNIIYGVYSRKLNSDVLIEIDKEFKRTIILNSIDCIRDELQIVYLGFKGIRFSDKSISIDSFFDNLIKDKDKFINKIKKAFKVFDDCDELKKSSNRLNNGATSIKNKNLIKTNNKEYIILKRDKDDLNKIIDNFIEKEIKKISNVKFNKEISKSKNKFKNELIDIGKEEGIDIYGNLTQNEINVLLDRIPSADDIKNNICVDKKYYDISEDMLKDKEFCRVLASELEKRGEFRLSQLFRYIVK